MTLRLSDINPYYTGQLPVKYSTERLRYPSRQETELGLSRQRENNKFRGNGAWFGAVLYENYQDPGNWFKNVTNLPHEWWYDSTQEKLSVDELNRRYGNLGVKFDEPMSEGRANVLIGRQQDLERAQQVAQNYEGGDIYNKIRFTLPTLIANAPTAAVEEAAVLGIGALTAGVGGAIAQTAVLGRYAQRFGRALEKTGRFVNRTSDFYSTNQLLKTAAHDATIINGVGALNSYFSYRGSGFDESEALKAAGQEFVLGAVLTPATLAVTRTGGLALQKIAATADELQSRYRQPKASIERSVGLDGSANSVNNNGVRTTVSETPPQALVEAIDTKAEASLTPSEVRSITEAVNVALDSTELVPDLSKRVIAGSEETLSDVLDSLDNQLSKQEVEKLNADFDEPVRVADEQQALVDQAIDPLTKTSELKLIGRELAELSGEDSRALLEAVELISSNRTEQGEATKALLSGIAEELGESADYRQLVEALPTEIQPSTTSSLYSPTQNVTPDTSTNRLALEQPIDTFSRRLIQVMKESPSVAERINETQQVVDGFTAAQKEEFKLGLLDDLESTTSLEVTPKLKEALGEFLNKDGVEDLLLRIGDPEVAKVIDSYVDCRRF